MTVALSPLFNNDSAQIDANGDPRTGAKLFTYLAGTTTKATTYKENTGSTAHTNPIVLDSNGLPPAPIWLTTGSSYKFVLAPSTDTDPPASAILTIDNITAVNDVSAPAAGTEWTASGMTPTYVSATSFTVSGDQTSTLEVDRRLKLTVTAGTVYGYITKTSYSSPNTTVTVLLDSGSLDSGLSAFSYGILSTGNTSLPFVSRDQQCGRLGYVSATSIRLDPQDGNTIWVYIGSNWRLRAIPSAGITAANTSVYVDGTSGQNLAASTTYYVYLFDNSGTLTMDFSTTAPAVDATSGLKIKTGVATRLLIGMVRTSASNQFQTPALVLSWYKRRKILASAKLTTNRTTTSVGTLVELNSEIRVSFCNWGDEAVESFYGGYASNGTADGGNEIAITMDGVATILSSTRAQTPTANGAVNQCISAANSPSEGNHYMTVAVYVVNASTGTWITDSANSGTLFVVTQG